MINNTETGNHASFNGPGGIAAPPNAEQRIAMNEEHFQPTANHFSHQQNARQKSSQWALANGGRPATTAMKRVNGSRYNQQGRIANGINSGQFNARLEGREANTNQEIRNERQANASVQ